MTRYASKTEVSSEKSRAEIERMLLRYGANQFMYGTTPEAAMIAFRAQGRHIRFILPFPSPTEQRFTHAKPRASYMSPPKRSEAAARAAWEQEVRSRWRALALVIKAKLEAVESGIAEFEDEFLAHVVLPNGQTMSSHARPLIARAYDSGQMPPLLPHFGGES